MVFGMLTCMLPLAQLSIGKAWLAVDVQCLPNLEMHLPNLEMAMGVSCCTALVASSI